MTQKQEEQEMRDILNKYNLNELLSIEDFCYACNYFKKYHHEWTLKLGTGIKSITVIPSVFGSRCFQINRYDGSFIDISFRISNIKKKNWKADFLSALRHLTQPYLNEYKSKNFKGFCDFSKDVVDIKDVHTDHYPLSFDKIAKEFILKESITKFENLTVEEKMINVLIDKNLAQRFIDYHNSVATYRLIKKELNIYFK